MRIAYVSDTVYPYELGGMQKRVWELARRLVQRGHEVTLFGMKYWGGEDVIYNEGVRLWGVCPSQALYVNGHRSIKQAVYFAGKVLRPLLKEKFDVIDCQEFPYFPCFSAKLCSVVKRTPLVITWFEVWDRYWSEYLGRKGVFGRGIERVTSYLSGSMIAVSQKVKDDLVSIGVSPDKVKVVPDGIDFTGIQRTDGRESKKYDILYSGRLIEHKNVDVLIRATDIVKRTTPDIKCGITGDGPAREYLEGLKKQLNLERNVEFFGFLERDEDVISKMKSSKVFALPSTREGAGLVTLEANACGLPVITVDHVANGAKEVVIEGLNGFLCELSEKELASKILMALDKSEAMKTACIEFSKGYDWGRIADLTESTYKEAVEDSGE